MSLDIEFRVLVRDVVREVMREEFGSPRSSTHLENELLTYEQAAELISVHCSTIKRWVSAGALPAMGKGKLRRVRSADVRACLQKDDATSIARPTETKATVTSILSTVRR